MAKKLDITLTGNKNGKATTRVITISNPNLAINKEVAQRLSEILVENNVVMVGDGPATGVVKIALNDTVSDVLFSDPSKDPNKKKK